MDARTIERYLDKYGDELGRNGYEVIRGKRLKLLKEAIKEQFVTDIRVGDKTPQLGISGSLCLNNEPYFFKLILCCFSHCHFDYWLQCCVSLSWRFPINTPT